MSTIKPKKIVLTNNKNFIIRTAAASDAENLVELMKEVTREKIYTIHEYDEYKETNSSYKRKIQKFRSSPGKIYIIAEIEKEIAGYVCFNNWDTRKTKHTGLLSIFIKKKWRGKGIGYILMQSLINWAKANKSIHKMSLAVFSSNKNAISLYKKLGFKIEGICQKDIKIGKKYVDSIFMYLFV